jgi:hypothetical protein
VISDAVERLTFGNTVEHIGYEKEKREEDERDLIGQHRQRSERVS